MTGGTPGGAYAVDPTELARTGVALGAEAAQLDDTLRRCQRTVDGLNGLWQGSSHARYEALYAEWQRGAEAVRHALAGLAAMTTRAADIYGRGEQGVGALMTGL